jgi:MFS family permease
MVIFTVGIGPLSFTETRIKQRSDRTKAKRSSSGKNASDVAFDDVSLAAIQPPQDVDMMSERYGLSARDLIYRLDFWLLFVALSCGFGAGLMVVNNIAQISRATGPEGSDKLGVVVSLFSIGSACGRLGFGIFTDMYAKEVSRLSVLTLMLVLMAAANVGLSFGSFQALCICVPLIGLTFGAQASASPLVVFEMWGEKSFGQNYGILLIGPLLGSLALSTFSASEFYERFADDDPEDDEHESFCDGVQCFRSALLINAGACAIGALSCLWVARISSGRGTKWSSIAREHELA